MYAQPQIKDFQLVSEGVGRGHHLLADNSKAAKHDGYEYGLWC